MRLPECKIKAAILHPDRLARQEAVHYFSNCFSQDADVLPLAIQAIEQYGRREAFYYIHPLADLAQTEATVEWTIRELHREVDRADHRHTYPSALSRLLCNADARLLFPRVQEILKAPRFLTDLTYDLQDRVDLLTWDGERCWKELEDICQEAVQPDMADVDFAHADRVVEALARQGAKYTARLLELLGQKVTDFENDPMSWLEIYLVKLAGVMRLEQAVPLIVGKLHDMGEILSEECVDALGRIGTDAAAEAVAAGWSAAEWEYRLSAVSALEKIHADATVRQCLELLQQEKDREIQTLLADALLAQLADEALEPARQMVERQAYDADYADLMGRIVAVSTIMEATFAELPLWKRQVEEKQARTEQRMRELDNPLQAVGSAALPPTAASPDYLEPERRPILRSAKQVGRNDPCPCGSGKKFKKCCISKQ